MGIVVGVEPDLGVFLDVVDGEADRPDGEGDDRHIEQRAQSADDDACDRQSFALLVRFVDLDQRDDREDQADRRDDECAYESGDAQAVPSVDLCGLPVVVALGVRGRIRGVVGGSVLCVVRLLGVWGAVCGLFGRRLAAVRVRLALVLSIGLLRLLGLLGGAVLRGGVLVVRLRDVWIGCRHGSSLPAGPAYMGAGCGPRWVAPRPNRHAPLRARREPISRPASRSRRRCDAPGWPARPPTRT